MRLMTICVILNLCAISGVYADEIITVGDYSLVHTDNTGDLIQGFDLKEFMDKNYGEFSFNYDHVNRYFSRQYSFIDENSQHRLFFTVGVYPTVGSAEIAVLSFMDDVVAVFREGLYDQRSIGDTQWWSCQFECQSEEKRVKNGLVFVRKNAFIGVHSDTRPDLIEQIAWQIDDAFLNGGDTVQLSPVVAPPVIDEVIFSKTEIELDETVTMTVNAYDPNGKNILYGSNPGLGECPETQNQFFINSWNWPEPEAGSQVIEVWVVNEDNLFSVLYPYTLTF